MAFVSVGALFWAADLRVGTIPTTFATLAVCFVLDDLRFYAHHRIAHRCRWVWAMHVVHHSSTHYNYAVALRQAWTKHFTGTMMLKLPLVLIGFDPVAVLFCGVVNAAYQFFLHTQLIDRLPRWFEFVFNTPSHHRVHHARNPQYLDANYGGTLIIWDRLFGTFEGEQANEPPEFGLVKNIDTYNPLRIEFHEYAAVLRDQLHRGIGLRARLGYLFGPPGYSHDGSRQTTEDIKRLHGVLPPAAQAVEAN
ncbi:MAG: sterol desaturase family protein [Pseudomonadaceae bacterium]|nr:sterol desaturase family protein [Pseudomonadaceae bacterium]